MTDKPQHELPPDKPITVRDLQAGIEGLVQALDRRFGEALATALKPLLERVGLLEELAMQQAAEREGHARARLH